MTKTRTSNLARKMPRLGQGLYYDPLYGYIPIANELRQLIDLEVFQRLRGVKQLSTLYLVFPGAVHTRFAHSVGVSYLARIVHNRLNDYITYSEDERVRSLKLNEITLRAMELGALLHDIGHGPFGHVFEMFCRRDSKFSEWTHEKWGRSLITGKDDKGKEKEEKIFQQIPKYLSSLKSALRKKHGDLQELELLEPNNIARICTGESPILSTDEMTKKYSFFKSVVPSAFGIDRLDYLRRDALYTGVKTGDIDIWEIIGNIELHFYNEECQLYLSSSASTALEALLKIRDTVYRQLYHNPIHRSAQELIIRALLGLSLPPSDLAFFSDYELLELFASSDTPFLNEIEERIRFRILYEVLPICSHTDISNKYALHSIKEDWNRLKGIEEKISREVTQSREGHIFYDFEMIPAFKKEDFEGEEGKLFFDSVSKQPKSLFELQRHMAQLFEGELPDGANKIEVYNNSISDVFVSFPYDYIEKEIIEISESEPNDVDRKLQKLYEEKIKPLVTGFFELIVSDKKNKNLEKIYERNEQRIRHYLYDLVSIRKNLLWVIDKE